MLPALGVAPPLAGLIAFIALDFAIWLEHVVFHKIPVLWRIHRVHHADPGSTSPQPFAFIPSKFCCR